MHTELTVVGQHREHEVRNRADADLKRPPSGIRSATSSAIRRSRSPAAGAGNSTSSKPDSQKPTMSETCSWLAPNVRGIRALTSTKNGTSPIIAAAYSASVPSEK